MVRAAAAAADVAQFGNDLGGIIRINSLSRVFRPTHGMKWNSGPRDDGQLHVRRSRTTVVRRGERSVYHPKH